MSYRAVAHKPMPPARTAAYKRLLGWRAPRGNRGSRRSHELGNHTADCFDSDAAWRNSDLAAQQELGLRAQWRAGLGAGGHRRAAADGAAVVGRCRSAAKPL